MFERICQRFKGFVEKNSRFCIIFIFNFVVVAVSSAFYPAFPTIMGYPPNAVEVSKSSGVSIGLQFAVIVFFTMLAGTLVFMRLLRGIGGWWHLTIGNEADKKEIARIRKKCINLPYLIFIGQIFFINAPLLLMLVIVMLILRSPVMINLKIFTIVFSLFTFVATFSHAFSRSIFIRILKRTYGGEGREGLRITLGKKLFIQIIPMIIIAMLLTAVVSYSRLMSEKGDLVYKTYRKELQNRFDVGPSIKNNMDMIRILEYVKRNEPGIRYFILKPSGEIIMSDGSIPSNYLDYYIRNPLKGDRIYGDSNEQQGVRAVVRGPDGIYGVGVVYDIGSNQTTRFFFSTFFILILANAFVLYYISRTLSSEVSSIAKSLLDIAEGETVDLNAKIPVTSNDEIGDLVIAFNKILEREKAHIREIEEKQAVMIEQERLASLGHLIGGIAHNLRTPIMSISGGIEGLKDLVKEYKESIDDEKVTREDHHAIAEEMSVWLKKMRPYCSYMSDIITAVKGQTIQGESEGMNFTLEELRSRIELLLEHEVKHKRCKLNIEIKTDEQIQIRGEISVLVQVLNNLIVNAAEAYEGKNGVIDLVITSEDKTVRIAVRDYGYGIPKAVQEKLFKGMITTKGKKGTGLGLYISYTNVKARFGGDLWFESLPGQGTTFHLDIPHL